jgi:hypothetical protein
VKRALVVLAALGAALGAACATTAAPSAPVATFDACSKVVLTQAEALVGAVTADLVSGNYVALLTTLGLSAGVPEVNCAVQLAISEMQKRAAFASDTEIAVAVARGNDWLATHR